MISQLPPADRERGVAAYSSGNHAQAVALAAGLCGTRATILMPTDSPGGEAGRHARTTGRHVVTYDRYTQDRQALGTQLAHGQRARPGAALRSTR